MLKWFMALIAGLLLAGPAGADIPEPVLRLEFAAAGMTRTDTGWELPGGSQAVKVEVVEGFLGQALRLTGDESRLVIPTGEGTAFTRRFTVMFWLRLRPPPGHRVASFILGDAGFTSGWRLLQLHGPFEPPYFMFQIGGAQDGEPARTDLTAGARAPVRDWLHVALTFDADLPERNLLVYLDGACSYTVGQGETARRIFWSAERRHPVLPSPTPGRLVIGGAQEQLPGFLGDLDLLQIYDTALPAAAIQAIRQRQLEERAAR